MTQEDIVVKYDLKPADHIYSTIMDAGIPYTHHGIYIGNNEVIHYARKRVNGEVRTKRVMSIKTTLKEFLEDGYTLKVIHHNEKKSGKLTTEVIEDATNRIGEKKYNYITYNCEDFAYDCSTDAPKSVQLNGISSILSVILLLGNLHPITRIASNLINIALIVYTEYFKVSKYNIRHA